MHERTTSGYACNDLSRAPIQERRVSATRRLLLPTPPLPLPHAGVCGNINFTSFPPGVSGGAACESRIISAGVDVRFDSVIISLSCFLLCFPFFPFHESVFRFTSRERGRMKEENPSELFHYPVRGRGFFIIFFPSLVIFIIRQFHTRDTENAARFLIVTLNSR